VFLPQQRGRIMAGTWGTCLTLFVKPLSKWFMIALFLQDFLIGISLGEVPCLCWSVSPFPNCVVSLCGLCWIAWQPSVNALIFFWSCRLQDTDSWFTEQCFQLHSLLFDS
jgi:hypothetical protein